MSSLITADLHLSDNPRDEYRWALFPWLRTQIQAIKAKELLLLGDITDAKDKHSSKLVNRVFQEIYALSQITNVIWLMGNHDRIDPSLPFFGFLDKCDNVRYISKAEVLTLSLGRALFVPAGELWDFEFTDIQYVFAHATFCGAKAENGITLTGVDPSVLEGLLGTLYAGDIHVPQPIGRYGEYCGAPYRVRFGDTYNPRVVALGSANGAEDLHFPGVSRHVVTIRNADDLAKYAEVRENDQVKLRVQLKRSEFPEWRKLRTLLVGEAEALGWEVCGVELLEFSPVRRRLGEDAQGTALRKSPEDHIREYAAVQKYKEPVVKFGLELLNV